MNKNKLYFVKLFLSNNEEYYRPESFEQLNVRHAISMITRFFILFMPPFGEEGVYCFANVGLSVCLSVCPSVDHMVSADYLKNHLSQSRHISHIAW
jgi:hypothetical protein